MLGKHTYILTELDVQILASISKRDYATIDEVCADLHAFPYLDVMRAIHNLTLHKYLVQHPCLNHSLYSMKPSTEKMLSHVVNEQE